MKDYTERFELERPALMAIAYQMLGERAAAQDLVQDVWELWNRADKAAIDSPPAWLRTVTNRLAIDALRSARKKREVYVGPWLPEPLIDDVQGGPDAALALAKDCELALMWAMERLTIEERSAFILRKAFDSDYAELSELLGKTEANCRKIVSRASQKIATTKLKFNVTQSETLAMLGKFTQACDAKNHEEVLSLLSPDVVSVSDGGGHVRAALRPLLGAQEVTSVLLSILRKYTNNSTIEVANVNAQPALIVSGNNTLNTVLAIGINDAGLIAWIYMMRNPYKLRLC
jgi:RNA polymerase sigma-70 factor (ECF subfamily)